MGYPLASKVLKTVPRAWLPQPPNIKMFCFHGNGMPTPASLTYPAGYFPDTTPNIDYEDGDGTVPSRSLEGCLRWRNKQHEPIVYELFHRAEHNGILGDARLLRSVIAALKETEADESLRV